MTEPCAWHRASEKSCRLYVTAEYARLPLMWGNTLFLPEGGEPDFVSLALPEWKERRVLVFPEMGLTIILGSSYKGGAEEGHTAAGDVLG